MLSGKLTYLPGSNQETYYALPMSKMRVLSCVQIIVKCLKFTPFCSLIPPSHVTVNSRLTDTSLIRTAAKSPAKINYRRLTERNSCYYGLSLFRTLTRGPEGVRNEAGELTVIGNVIPGSFCFRFYFVLALHQSKAWCEVTGEGWFVHLLNF